MIGHIDSIETLGLVDGPGIRVVVFLQGCPLRCLFCHNPETWFLNDKFLITPDELVRHIYKYRNYFGNDGGVTFSGGEPLFQHDFLLECLKLCKKMGIHTCKGLDSEGYRDMTGQDINPSLRFLRYCQSNGVKMWIRQVIVPAINDNIDYINRLKDFIKPLKNIEKVELLPYHLLGVSKYRQLGFPYRLENVPAMDKSKCDELYKVLMS